MLRELARDCFTKTFVTYPCHSASGPLILTRGSHEDMLRKISIADTWKVKDLVPSTELLISQADVFSYTANEVLIETSISFNFEIYLRQHFF